MDFELDFSRFIVFYSERMETQLPKDLGHVTKVEPEDKFFSMIDC